MKILYALGLVFLCSFRIEAQTFSLKELENQFIENNYYLLAKKYQIAEAEAKVIQEKLFPNPSLAVSEINLWKNSSSETLPFMFGKTGQYQQVAIELEQLIETAGKRKKRVALREAEVKLSSFEFEETLRELKKELRLNYWSLFYLNENLKHTQELLQLYEQLHEQFSKQVQLQNVSQANAYRIRTALINLQAEKARLVQAQFEPLKILRILVQKADLEVENLHFEMNAPQEYEIGEMQLKEWAKEQNIALKIQENKTELAQKQLSLEQAMAKPDLYLQLNYDRGGNIMHNFVGVGIQMDLPIFNKNKGNILAAKQQINHQNKLTEHLKTEIENEIETHTKQFLLYKNLLFSNPSQSIGQNLFQNYLKNFQNKQISLMEFLDFSESHLETLKVENEWKNGLINAYEQLQYLTGKDFK